MTSLRFAVLAFPAVLLALAGCEDPAKDAPKATVTAPVETAAAKPTAVTKPAAETKPAETKPAAPTPASPPLTLTPAAGETAYALDPASTIGFVGSKVTGNHKGSFSTFNGTIATAMSSGKAQSGQVVVEIDLGSVKTDNDKLDGHLKSPDFFDTGKFPKATFRSTGIKLGGDKGATNTVTGELDLHGVKKTVSFPATILAAGDGLTIAAEFSINRKDFGIVYAGKADDLIRDDVLIKLNLKAKKK